MNSRIYPETDIASFSLYGADIPLLSFSVSGMTGNPFIGLPAAIGHSPVLKYVLSEPDSYAYSEERRVFYVGITRAKKHTWVLYDINNPSPFVREFVNLPEAQVEPASSIPEDHLCPKCHCGRVKVAKKGTAVNGNPYSVLVCSNEKYGCDYRETVFFNLNAHRKRPRYLSSSQ